MRNLQPRHILAAATVAITVALAGCGSSSDDGPSAGAPASQVPASAQASVSGLIAYLNELINTMTNETSEPIVLGDAVLPTSETDGPAPLSP